MIQSRVLIGFASLLLVPLLAGCANGAEAPEETGTSLDQQTPTGERRQYTFSWMFTPGDAMAPRGGTTTGADEFTLVTGPTEAWEALREPGLEPRERDRRAILAMAGPWRTSFDFIETAGFVPDYQPARPYRSWGTEYVYIVENRPDFISLQHLLVMFTQNKEGETQGPFVTKHWRQDWAYEAANFHEYQGRGRWTETQVSERERRGAWVQTVWQVDDSPRYASIGRWEHRAGLSQWTGSRTLRPLPRREFSVRDDYDALRAVNRHIITPTGWVHEQTNDKLVLKSEPQIIVREAGLNRYERITGQDFSAGHAYWEKTQPFWALVRNAWDEIMTEHPSFRFQAETDSGKLIMKLFKRAQAIDAQTDFDAEAAQAFINRTLAEHVSVDEYN